MFIHILNIIRLDLSKPKPYASSDLPLQSGLSKDFVTIIIGGITVIIPSCYASMVKNFGINYFIGIPLIGTITGLIVYTMPGSVSSSDLQDQLGQITTDLDRLFSQLNLFISQFHNFINQSNINVITDAQGQLSIDVLDTVDDSTSEQYANRINVFDRLVRNHMESAETMLDRMSDLEGQISGLDPNYVSRVQNYRNTLNVLIRYYGH